MIDFRPNWPLHFSGPHFLFQSPSVKGKSFKWSSLTQPMSAILQLTCENSKYNTDTFHQNNGFCIVDL